MEEPSPPARTYMTLRLDALNSMAKQLGSRRHEEALGLTLREVRLLLLIYENTEMTVNRLVEMSYLERTIVSKGVSQLTRLNLVERKVLTTDARQIGLLLTEKGRKTAAKAREIALQGIDSMLSVLTPQELAVFDTALDKMTTKVRSELDELVRSESIPLTKKRAGVSK